MVIVIVIMAMVMMRNKNKGLITVDKWRLAMVNDGCLMDHQCLIDGNYCLMNSFNHGYQWLLLCSHNFAQLRHSSSENKLVSVFIVTVLWGYFIV